jgi:hypothetical protein
MKPNYYYIFQNKLLEAAEVTPVENESNLDKILNKSPKVTSVLVKLLTSKGSKNEAAVEQIRNTVSDIRCISYKPTTFRVVIPNGNYFDLKYNPTPNELKYPEDFTPADAFQVIVSGKKYDIANKSEYEQALDYINNLLKTNPITKEPEPGEEPAAPGAEPGAEPIAEPGAEEPAAPPEEETPEPEKKPK